MKLSAFNLFTLSLAASGATRSAPDNCATEEHGFLKCIDITRISDRVIISKYSECCSHEDCGEGECCRWHTHAMYCTDPRQYPTYYPPVCNDHPVEGKCKADIREPEECFTYDDHDNVEWELVWDNDKTNCNFSEDCPRSERCILFGDPVSNPERAWLECDPKPYFDGDLKYVCLEIDATA